MRLPESQALKTIADAIEKERTTRLANSPAYLYFSKLSQKEIEYLAAIAIQALKNAGYVFEKDHLEGPSEDLRA